MEYLKDKKECLVVVDSRQEKRVILCGMDQKEKEKEEWIHDIKFFKDYCFHELSPGKGKLGSNGEEGGSGSSKSDEDMIKDDPLLNIKNREMQEEMAYKRQQDSENNADNQELEQQKLKDQMESVQKMAMSAMEQELKYESRMEKEEKMREKRMDSEMTQKLEEMKEKEECLKRGIAKQQQKAMGDSKHADMAAKINQIKESIRNMILKNRQKHKEKMSVMRKLSERKKQNQNKEMYEIKMKLANEVMDGDKKGDKETCFSKDENTIKDNCKEWFTDEIELRNCIKKDYCEMCCEKSFGDANMDKKMECIAGCIKIEKGLDPNADITESSSSESSSSSSSSESSSCNKSCDADKGDGKWVWVPKENGVK